MKWGLFLLAENFYQDSIKTITADIDTATYAEKLGFDEIWFAEHHFNTFSVIPNPALMMSYLAAKTIKIRIGSAAFLAPFYHPIRLAEEIATLDTLSQGRINAGFAKGGFALDMEFFNQSSETLRTKMFHTIEKIEQMLYGNSWFQPKPIQHKIPFFVATFSTFETIEFAAKNGYGLMFSQGATLKECEEAQEAYQKIAGFYPETILMRVFALAQSTKEAYRMAIQATEHFVKSMRAIQRHEKQPLFDPKNYEELLNQRYEFFDANKFLEAGIIGDEESCLKHIQTIKRRVKNLHLVLKPASTNIQETKKMLKEFSEKIKLKV